MELMQTCTTCGTDHPRREYRIVGTNRRRGECRACARRTVAKARYAKSRAEQQRMQLRTQVKEPVLALGFKLLRGVVVPVCRTCGEVAEAACLTAGRCPTCHSHFIQRARYTDNPVRQQQSRTATIYARKYPKQSHHCPACHHFRHKTSFLSIRDPFATCAVCRNLDFAQGAQKKHLKQVFEKHGLDWGQGEYLGVKGTGGENHG